VLQCVDGKIKGLSLKVDKTLEAVGDIICGNDISTVNGININNCEVPFTTYLI